MRPTTPEYREEIRAHRRDYQYMRVEFGLFNPEAYMSEDITTNSALPYSSFEHLTNPLTIVEDSYATLENGRWKADGRLLWEPENPAEYIYQGYVSGALSRADGTFATPPYVNISFGGMLMDFPGVTLIFDAVMKLYPKSIRIQVTGTQGYDATKDMAEWEHLEVKPLRSVSNIRITFLSTQLPYQHVRLMGLHYGIGIVWDGDHISSTGGVTKIADVDPVNRRLPITKCEINILDREKLFNLDNPEGIFSVLTSQYPIEVFYGKRIPKPLMWGSIKDVIWRDVRRSRWGDLAQGGYVDWLSVGNFLLDGAPSWNEGTVTFNCTDLIGTMTNEYYKGVYARRDLYSLAVDIMDDARLPRRSDGIPHHVLWDGLKNIYTDNPMEVNSHRECLRRIADAANCVFYCDWQNLLHIEPIDMTQHDFFMDNEVNKVVPRTELVPFLYAVDSMVTKLYRETDAAGAVVRREIHRSERAVSGTVDLTIKYQMSADVTVNVTGAAVTAQRIYASACELTLQGNGNAAISIMGARLISSEMPVRAYNEDGDENGNIETLHNSLISDPVLAGEHAAHHKDWLKLRTTYDADWRGNPALEVLDMIHAQSEFTDKMISRVLRHEWTFNGGLTAKAILKRIGEIL